MGMNLLAIEILKLSSSSLFRSRISTEMCLGPFDDMSRTTENQCFGAILAFDRVK